MGDYGIKVSNNGTAITSTDIRDYSLWSKYTMLKYYSDTTGSVVITAGATTGTLTFTHSLGYTPFFIAYVQHTWHDTVERMLPYGGAGAPLSEQAYANSGSVVMRINLVARGTNVTDTFRCIIFQDKMV